jgi:hypothetical protein
VILTTDKESLSEHAGSCLLGEGLLHLDHLLLQLSHIVHALIQLAVENGAPCTSYVIVQPKLFGRKATFSRVTKVEGHGLTCLLATRHHMRKNGLL